MHRNGGFFCEGTVLIGHTSTPQDPRELHPNDPLLKEVRRGGEAEGRRGGQKGRKGESQAEMQRGRETER